jgi:hypothetical protein
MKKSLIVTLITIMFSASSYGSLMIEPYLGYTFGGGEQDLGGNSKYDYSYHHPMLGLRLGGSLLGFMAGLDYSGSLLSSFSMDVEQKAGSSTTDYNDDVNKTQFGLFVGYDFPILLRAWATYYLSAKLEGESAVAAGTNQIYTTNYSESGSGIGFGVGFTPLPLISVNLEYRKFTYDEWENSTGNPSSGTFGDSTYPTYKDVELTEILLSVSLPFDLL